MFPVDKGNIAMLPSSAGNIAMLPSREGNIAMLPSLAGTLMTYISIIILKHKLITWRHKNLPELLQVQTLFIALAPLSTVKLIILWTRIESFGVRLYLVC